MLRVSATATEREISISMINGESDESDVDYAEQLMKFAAAVASFDEDALATARENLLRATGEAVLVDAAAVAGNFQRMVRIADATGIPVDAMDNDISNQVRDSWTFMSSKVRRTHQRRFSAEAGLSVS